jgi:hypothetical protein
MFDELAIEKRPRWDDKSNKVVGVCCEHRQGTSLEFASEDNLDVLWEELKSEKIHLAHEVRAYVNCSLPYFPIASIMHIHLIQHIFAISGDCWSSCSLKPSGMTLQRLPHPRLWKLQA